MNRQRLFIILGVGIGLALGALLVTHIQNVRRQRAVIDMVRRLGGAYFLAGQALDDGTIVENRSLAERLRLAVQPVFPSALKQIGIGGWPPTLSGSWVVLDRQPAPPKKPVAFPSYARTRLRATDADIAVLKGLAGLEHLDVSYSQVTDATIDDLCSLPHLKYLWLDGCQITTQGIAELRRRRPNLSIALLPPLPPEPTPVDNSTLGPDRFLPLEVEQELLAP